MEAQNHKNSRLPYPPAFAAAGGNPDAVQEVLEYSPGYIVTLAKKRGYGRNGKYVSRMDDELRKRFGIE